MEQRLPGPRLTELVNIDIETHFKEGILFGTPRNNCDSTMFAVCLSREGRIPAMKVTTAMLTVHTTFSVSRLVIIVSIEL